MLMAMALMGWVWSADSGSCCKALANMAAAADMMSNGLWFSHS